MPLLDHFRPPIAPFWQWGSIHDAWINAITQQLNRDLLPPDYYAQPNVRLGSEFEVAAATLHHNAADAGNGAPVATAAWAPPAPAQSVPVDFVHWETFEVKVLQDLGGPQLRAAIELVSPANKDRPSHRQTFALKCAAYLEQAVSLVIIDVVTERLANLHAELLHRLGLPADLAWASPTNLYAVSYRVARSQGGRRLELWREPLAVGNALPRMPLWIDAEVCLPLDLEESYSATCRDLRIRV